MTGLQFQKGRPGDSLITDIDIDMNKVGSGLGGTANVKTLWWELPCFREQQGGQCDRNTVTKAVTVGYRSAQDRALRALQAFGFYSRCDTKPFKRGRCTLTLRGLLWVLCRKLTQRRHQWRQGDNLEGTATFQARDGNGFSRNDSIGGGKVVGFKMYFVGGVDRICQRTGQQGIGLYNVLFLKMFCC